MTHTKSASADLRVKRTHKLLMAALLELTIQKGFSAVSVSNLANYAGINRATFYRHYQDKFDLLNQYAQTIYELLDAPLESRPQPSSQGKAEQITAGLVRIFEHIRVNARFYRVMLGKNGDPVFTEKIRQYVQKRIWRSLPAGVQTDERWVKLYLSSSSSASIGAVMWWLEHDMPHSAEEMANISYQLSGAILSALMPAPASAASGSPPQSMPHH